MLETVGTSAYTGAAHFFSNKVKIASNRLSTLFDLADVINFDILKDFITSAGTILAIEARHAAWLSSALEKANPWSASFEVMTIPLHRSQLFF